MSQEQKPRARWKPEWNETYWFVDFWGEAGSRAWLDYALDRFHCDSGNCFPTKKAAERHAKRLRSMSPTFLPKFGKMYWTLDLISPGEMRFIEYKWKDDPVDFFLHRLGIVKETEADIKAWWQEFGEAWTALEDAS